LFVQIRLTPGPSPKDERVNCPFALNLQVIWGIILSNKVL